MINTKETMKLVQADTNDFSAIRAAYIDIIEHTPGLPEQTKWNYGLHPSDEDIMEYIEGGNMYMYKDGEAIAGVVALVFSQNEDYHPVNWTTEAEDDEVLVPHILALTPAYRSSGIGTHMLQAMLQEGKKKGNKVCRLDTLATNLTGQHFYTRQGFTYCGIQNWYAGNAGWIDFMMYEKVIE